MLKPPKYKQVYLPEETYLALIRNSAGTGMFRSAYVRRGGKKVDVLKAGELACAVYASSVLYLFGLVKAVHATVYKTAEDLLKSGAKKIPLGQARPGDVLVWVPTREKSGPHNHIGFYVGNRQAVSNSTKRRVIARHHYTYNGRRPVEMVLRPKWRKHA